MATYSHAGSGVSVTWGGITFGEVYACSWNFGGDRQGRPTNWIPNPGQLTISCYSAGTLSTSNVGTRAAVAVSSSGASYDGYAILNDLSVEYELNGVIRYTLAFTLCDVNP